MSITLSALQKQRRDTAANWTAEDPTLLAGEIGLESDTGYWKVGDGATAWTSLAYVSGLGAEIPVDRLADGAARQLLQTDAAGTGVEWTDDIDVPGTLDVTGAATFDDDVTIQGDLTVNGTTTTIDTTTLVVEDKNIEIGKVATPSDVTADGGGLTLKGSTDKTISWVDATDAWTLSEHVDLASAKEYRIAGTKVLDSTSLGSAVVSSSLTSVGTIGTGVWNGTAVATGYGGTGQTTYTDGEVLIGKTDGTLAKATLTAGSGVTITNADGSITIDATGGLPTSGGVMTGALGIIPGTTSAPGLYFSGDTNTGLHSSAVDNIELVTDGEIRFAIDDNGDATFNRNVTIDRALGDLTFHVKATGTPGSDTDAIIRIDAGNGGESTIEFDQLGLSGGLIQYEHSLDELRIRAANTVDLWTSGSSSLLIDSSGNTTLSGGLTAGSDITLNAQSDLRFADSDSSNWVAFQAPATVASNVTWTLPNADGTSGQVLSTDGAGALSWATAGGGATDKIEEGNTSAEVIDTGSDGRFVVTTEGTEALRVDSNGRVGIGTTPSTTLHLSAAQAELQIQSTSGTTPGFLSFIPGGASQPYYIYVDGSRNLIIDDYATERMRIGSNGRVNIGTTSSRAQLDIGFDSSTVVGLALSNASTGTSARFYSGASIVGTITVTGSATAYNTSSDYRLKENVGPLTGAADRLKQIPVHRFNFIADPNTTVDGFLAHEAQAVVPECVTGTKDEVDDEGNPVYQGIDQSKLVPLLTAALQEAMERIEVLEAKVNALEGN